MNTKQIVQLIHEASGIAGSEEFCCFGNAMRPVNSVLVCWMATSEAIQHAIEIEADLIICHEAFFLPYLVELNGGSGDFLSYPANYRRTSVLAKHGIAIARIHPSMDKITILDRFADQLKLGKPVADDGCWARMYDFDKPVTFSRLVDHVEQCGFPVMRCSDTDPDKVIKHIGLPWGGMSLFVNINYMQQLVEMGCDAFVAGEADSYSFHFARESGVGMIETGHEYSENPGVEAFADWLRNKLENTRVEYYQTSPAYVFSRQDGYS